MWEGADRALGLPVLRSGPISPPLDLPPWGLFLGKRKAEPEPALVSGRAGCDRVSLLRQVIEFDDGAGSVLRIQPLRVQRDEAIYECTATNSLGEINTSAKLSVLEGTCWKGMRHRRVGRLM